MILENELLFRKKRLFELFHEQLKSLQSEVDKISKEKFLANTDDQIVKHIFSILEIIPLKIDKMKIDRSEPKEINLSKQGPFGERISCPSVEIIISIPFTGNSDLWEYQPSSFDFNPPRGEIQRSRLDRLSGNLNLRLGYYHNEFIGEAVNKEVNEVLKSLDFYLQVIEKDIAKHSQEMIQKIQQLVKNRRERLNAILREEDSILIPIKRKSDAPEIRELPIIRKTVKTLSEKSYNEISFSISDSNYEHILGLIRNQGATYERTPKTYHIHNEEELRDILLSQLNGFFEGKASGETFRNNGKTDICIEEKNRAAFVAECKIWNGEKKVLEAVDQLLDYLTWRDVKTALIIFNKDVSGFMDLQIRVPEILKSHAHFVNHSSKINNTEWRMKFKSKFDEKSIIEMHIFLFNLFHLKK